ncbi:MAG: hypothetical protein ACP5NK_07390 [Thermoplasmata archaeon]
MRLVHIITAALLAAALLSVCIPANSGDSAGHSNVLISSEHPYGLVSNNVMRIGSNLSYSDYYFSGNLDVGLGAILSIVNVRMYVEGADSIINDSGSLYVYNSTVIIGNSFRNATAISVYGQRDSRATLTSYNSTIVFAGMMKADNSSVYGFNSSFGENQTIHPGVSSFLFVHSRIVLYRSRLTGLDSTGNASMFETLAEHSTNSPIFTSQDLAMSVDLLQYPDALSGILNMSLEYSGDNPFNENYLLLNVSGNTIDRVDFNSTGSVTQYSWVNASIPVEQLQINGSTMESEMTLYFHYDPAKYSNTTIWNASVEVISNDSVDRIGARFFRDQFSNSTAYLADTQLGINDMPFRNSYGNPDGHKDYALITNDSRIYDYGVSYEMTSSRNNQSAYSISENSSLMVGRMVNIHASENGTPVNNVNYVLNPAEINSTSYSISENVISKEYDLLSGYGIFNGFTFKNGSSTLPVISNVITGSGESQYIGDYSLSVNTQIFCFSVPGFPFESTAGIYVNITPSLPVLRVIPLTRSALIGSSDVISAYVFTDYPRMINVTYDLLFQNNGTAIISGNATIDGNSILNLTVPGYSEIVPGYSNLTLMLKSSMQIQNGNLQAFTFPVEFIRPVPVSINLTYSPQKGIVSMNVANSANFSVNNITIQESESGSNFSTRNFTGIDLKSHQTITLILPAPSNHTAEFTGRLLMPEFFQDTLQDASSITVVPQVNYAELHVMESGLPQNYSWGITIAGGLYQTNSRQMNVSLPAGSYNISFMKSGTYHPEYSGESVAISGPHTNLTIDYMPEMVTLLIEMRGLPQGTVWGVNVSGNVTVTGLTQISLQLPVGQYDVTGTEITGYSTGNAPMIVNVKNNTTVVILYTSESHGMFYPVTAFVHAEYPSILVILFSAIVLLEYRRSRSVLYSPLHKGMHFQKKKIK